MGDQIAIAALIRKRAELAGEIVRAQKDITRLRREIANLDAALRIFDPDRAPAPIRPVVKVKHRVVPKLRHGEFGRIVLTTLRGATEPLSVGEIVEQVAATHGIDVSTPKARQVVTGKVRNYLWQQKPETVTKGQRGGTVVWGVA